MYSNIFRELVDIMHHDYAGCHDKKGWDNPEKYEEKIKGLEKKGELDAHLFIEIVEDYLLDFKDPHMFLNMIKSDEQKEYDSGFRVRRFEDKLFVTTISNENRLKPGDAIVSLDNISINDLVKRHKRELMEIRAEREDWRKVIPKYNVAEILDSNGNTRMIELRKYEKPEYTPEHSVTRLDSETLYMKLTDFFEADSIDKLVKKHENELKQTKNLVVDVRVNYGGSTLAYSSLEKYLFPSGTMKVDYDDYNMEFNCTVRNSELMIGLIDEELTKIENEDYRKGLEQWKEETWVKNKGKGFVSFDEDNEVVEITGCELPENIVVLTDNYCGSAGDIFVYLCKMSPKVTVIGRPTMGVNDYSNLTTIKWDEKFEFSYPTSRLKSLDNRRALDNPGIKPDIYIPWTPEHLYKDVDMEEAIRILKSKTTV
ncbi:S41 family peptidase [Ornithinibacillus halophilus]|uniref:Peptidase family S41 n=1 Tax=Ornithinibacillus halophilus TaxID=930117 RepID=A0A1M5DVZ4_9BACI|nr:S41 family peptidase [Ornithinibacillus halophilus]SHF71034.1 Peptidase family S41 [Ornithinibacillus halophilus]